MSALRHGLADTLYLWQTGRECKIGDCRCSGPGGGPLPPNRRRSLRKRPYVWLDKPWLFRCNACNLHSWRNTFEEGLELVRHHVC